MSFRDRNLESINAAFFLGAVVVLLFVAGVVGGLFTVTNSYRLVLDDGVGLSPGVDVTIAGMKVGTVDQVTLTDDRRVELELSVKRRYAHHVKVDSVGMAAMTLSGKVVRIDAGSPTAVALADGGTLRSGENFDLLKALENMDLVHNIEQVEAILRDLNELGRQVQLGDGRIPEAIDGVMSLIEDLQAGRGTLGRLLKDEKTLVDIEALIVSVDEMAASVESAAVQLEKTSGAVDQASGSIVDGAGHIATASEALGRTALSVDASASKLANSLDRLDAGLVELEKTMRAIQGLPLVRKQVEKNEEE